MEIRVVVSGFEVVEAGIGVEVVAAVADRVYRRHRAGRRQHLAPCVVAVLRYRRPAGVQYAYYITLQVRHVVVHDRRRRCRRLVRERIRRSVLIVEELKLRTAEVLGYQLAALPYVLVLYAADRLRQTQTVHVVGVAVVETRAAVYRAREPAPVGPRERRPVVPARRVAYAVIADALTVIRRQQIQPAAVTVAVHLCRRPVRYRPDVSVGVIGVGVGLAAVGLGKKLPLRIVGVRRRRAAAYCRDVAGVVVGIGVAVDARAIGLAVIHARNQHRSRVRAIAVQIRVVPVYEGRTVERQAPAGQTLQSIVSVRIAAVCRELHTRQLAVIGIIGVAVSAPVSERTVPCRAYHVPDVLDAVRAVIRCRIELHRI